jgi:hypothetical protein
MAEVQSRWVGLESVGPESAVLESVALESVALELELGPPSAHTR